MQRASARRPPRGASARLPSRRSSSRRRASHRRARRRTAICGAPGGRRAPGVAQRPVALRPGRRVRLEQQLPAGRDLGGLVDVAPADPPVPVGQTLEIALRLREDRRRDHDRRVERDLPALAAVDAQDDARASAPASTAGRRCRTTLTVSGPSARASCCHAVAVPGPIVKLGSRPPSSQSISPVAESRSYSAHVLRAEIRIAAAGAQRDRVEVEPVVGPGGARAAHRHVGVGQRHVVERVPLAHDEPRARCRSPARHAS